jgi:hypothetical protein
MALREKTSKRLRVIGQVLDKEGIDLFELRYSGDEYRLLCGDPEPPHLRLVEMRYSGDEIEALDAEARKQRRGQFALVNFDSLPEILRAAGRKIDNQRGKLVRIGNSEASISANTIRVDYQTPDGRIHSEDIALATVADLALRMYKERSDRFNDATAK